MKISDFSYQTKQNKTKQNLRVGTGKIFIIFTPKNHRTGLEVPKFATKNHKRLTLKAFWNNYPHLTMKLNCARTGCFKVNLNENLQI